jgi:predicted DNA-binding protein
MKNLHEVVDTYTDKDKNPSYLGREVVSVSARIDIEAKIKLKFLSALFGKKQTPLLAELIETAINEVFDQVEMPEELQKEYASDIKEISKK